MFKKFCLKDVLKVKGGESVFVKVEYYCTESVGCSTRKVVLDDWDDSDRSWLFFRVVEFNLVFVKRGRGIGDVN